MVTHNSGISSRSEVHLLDYETCIPPHKPGLLYADDLVLCGKLEDDLRVMVGRFVNVCRRRGLKINAGKSKVMVMNGEEGLECEVHIDRIRLEHVSEFNYLECVLDESGTDGAECSRKVLVGEGGRCYWVPS